MIDHGRGASRRVGHRRAESLVTSSPGYPPGVSVRWNFMIAKDPHPHSTKTLRQEQCLRDHGGAAGVIYVLNPEYPDFIPSASASTSIPAGPREQNPGSSSSVSVAGTTLTGVERPGS